MVEYERGLLAALIKSPSLLGSLEINDEIFSTPQHRRLLDLIKQRFAQGDRVDSDSLFQYLAEYEKAHLFGGFSYLSELMVVEGDPEHLLKELTRLSRKKAAKLTLSTALQHLNEPTEQVEDVIAGVVSNLVENHTPTTFISPILPLLKTVHAAEMARLNPGGSIPYLNTGIEGFDRRFIGVTQRGVTLVIGASGMGKTTFANRLVLGMAMQGYRVGVHGTETTVKERTEDLLFSFGRINPSEWFALVDLGVNRDERQEERTRVISRRITVAAEALGLLPIKISSKRGGTVEAVCARFRAMHTAGDLQVAIVDYLQDFTTSTGIRPGDTLAQVSHTSSMLKDLSADLGIPIIVTAQRSDEKRGMTPVTARPQMWDCQWASRAHQDAEEVFGLYRDDYYLDSIDNWKSPDGVIRNTIEVIRRKVRRGMQGTATLKWDGPTRWIGHSLKELPELPEAY